jgi:hypothetical protein
MDNPVIFVLSRASNLNVTGKKWFKIRIYRFGFAGWNMNKSNIQTILLFTKQRLLVFNVGKIRLNVAYWHLYVIYTIQSILRYWKFYVMTKYHFTLLPINQTWYGKNEMHFWIQHNEISKTHLFWFLPQKKRGFFCRLVNCNSDCKI